MLDFTLAKEYAEYSKAILPKECSKAQKDGTKEAFYAGALVVFRLLGLLALPENEDSIELADTVNEECIKEIQKMIALRFERN